MMCVFRTATCQENSHQTSWSSDQAFHFSGHIWSALHESFATMSCVVSRATSAAVVNHGCTPSSRRAHHHRGASTSISRRPVVPIRRSASRSVHTAALPNFFENFANPFVGTGGNAAKRTQAKKELLEAIEGCERGVTADDETKELIYIAAQKLEKLNPNRDALSSNLLNGEWELLYTTSASILGATKPWPFRPLGPIYQTIDTGRLRVRNRETFPFFNAVDADLTPTSKSAVNVQFVQFEIFGLLKVTAPESAKGALNTTYLDDELRVSRGDKGNLFVLSMYDDSKELPRKGDEEE